MLTKDTNNIGQESPAAEGMTSKVAVSSTSDSQVAGIIVEKGMEEHAEKHQNGMVQEYPGPMLTFSDPLTKPNLNPTNTPVPPTPESHSSTVRQFTPITPQHSGPIYNPEELRSIFPAELPPRPAPKASFFSRIFKRNSQQSEDIEMGRRTSPNRQSPRCTLLPVKCHWSFLVGGWVFLLSCGAIVYWGMAEQFNTGESVGQDGDGAVQMAVAMLKR